MGSLYAIIIPIMALVGLVVTASYYLKLDPMIAKVALGVGALAICLVTMIGLVRRLRGSGGERKVNPEKEARRQLRAARRAEAKALRRRFRALLREVRATDRELRARGQGARPWWLVIGPSGHGKSQLLAAAPGSREIAGEADASAQPRFFSAEAGVFLELPADYDLRPTATLALGGLVRGLRSARPRQPVVGILVVRRADAHPAGGPESAAEVTALRRLIDRLSRELEVQAPITLVATQLDRLAGLGDLCADVDHVDVQRALGVTLDPRATANTVEASARARFTADDGPLAWVEALCHVQVVRSQAAPERQSRLYGLWQHLAELSVDAGAFAARLAATPLPGGDPLPIRGIYFTAAEGHMHPEPDVFFERLARAVGGGLPAATEAPPTPPPHSFVTSLFATELPRDSVYGARLSGHRRRVYALRATSAAALLVLGGLVAVSATRSAAANRNLLEKTGNFGLKVLEPRGLAEDGSLRSSREIAPLHHLVDLWRAEDPPEGHGWGLFRGDIVAAPVLITYRNAICREVLRPLAVRTEEELRRFALDYSGGGVPTSGEQRESFDRLRYYLLLSFVASSSSSTTSIADDVPARPWSDARLRPWLIARTALLWGPAGEGPQEPAARERAAILETYAALLASAGEDASAEDVCLRSGGDRALPRDQDVVRRVREILRREHGDAATIDRLVDAINSHRSIRPITLISLTRASHIHSREGLEVPGAFTSAGWDEFSRLVTQEINGELHGDAWVLGRERRAEARDARCRALVGIYVDRYQTAWRHFLGDLYLRTPGTLSEASAIYRDLSDHKPLTAVFQALDAHTQTLPPITCAAPAKSGSWAQQLIARANETAEAAAADPEQGKNAAYLADVFDRLLGLAVAPEAKGQGGGAEPNLGIDTYHEQLVRLRQAADQAIENRDRIAELDEALDQALATVDSTIKRSDLGAWEDDVKRLLMPPLRGLDVILKVSRATSLNEEWCRRVIGPLRQTLVSTYPFDRDARVHATLDHIRDLFHPESGEIARFRDEKLGGFVTLTRDAVEAKDLGVEAKLHLSPAIVAFLAHARELGVLLFPDGEASVDFSMDMTCDRRINKVELWIDEVPHDYMCSINQRKEVHWPGKGATHAAKIIAFSTTSKQDKHERPGEFGLFELIEKVGAPRTDPNGNIVLTFDMRTYGKITVRVRPKKPRGGTIFHGFGGDARFLAPFRAAGFTQPPTSLFTEHAYSCSSLEGI